MAWLQCLLHGHLWEYDGDGITCKRCGKHVKVG